MRLVTLLICLSKTGIQSSGPKSIEIYKKKKYFLNIVNPFLILGVDVSWSLCVCPGSLIIILI